MSTQTNERAHALETSLLRIEEIATALDREEMDLERALVLFQEGVQNVQNARRTLEAAELQVETLVTALAGGASD